MKITYHAAQRFLERVMSRVKYTHQDVEFAMRYLEKLLKNVVIGNRVKHFVLPGFEDYKVVYRENVVVTIVPKGARYAY